MDNILYETQDTDRQGKKLRSCSTSSTDSTEFTNQTQRDLEWDTVKEIFARYDLAEGENISCFICGKHYKSRVCVKKHLWEHSLYWDLFDGLNKQQRVLSIQAAIILSIKSNPSLSVLLVTSPNNGKKKDKKDSSSITENSQRKDLYESKKRKRKHTTSLDCDFKGSELK